MILPVSQAQMSPQGPSIKISSYQDDPFVAESDVERLDASRFSQDSSGHPYMSGDRVSMIAVSFIYRLNPATGRYEKFAWNPWPDARSNEKGNFRFADETRFPLHEVERDAEGKPVLRDGLQVWKPRDLHLGITTAFAAANAARDAAEFWAGRDVPWGEKNGILEIESHVFIGFNAFYSGTTRGLFFGVIPYRLPGETQIKMFETATSWELVAHEAGHAVHHVLKPNRVPGDRGYDTWSESLSDQMAMWVSLRDPQRVRAVLAETSGNLHTSNSLSRHVEAFAALTGRGTGTRDAFHEKKVSDTTDEVHDRSEVLTGAAYKVFTQIYDELKSQGLEEPKALTKAGEIMGVFLAYSTDYTPENTMALEDVAKAHLKVDKEHFGSRYHDRLVSEFTRRELFDATSVAEWQAHEAAVPDLKLPPSRSDQDIDQLVRANLDRLGLGPDFGLKLQGVTRESRFGQTLVRVQLTQGRGQDAPLLDNHGLLTFRSDGTLADYHTPLPAAAGFQIETQMQIQVEATALMEESKRLGLDGHGAPLALVRRPDGRLTVEARVLRGEGLDCWADVFSMDHPEGERREVITPTFPRPRRGRQPSGVEILTDDDLND